MTGGSPNPPEISRRGTTRIRSVGEIRHVGVDALPNESVPPPRWKPDMSHFVSWVWDETHNDAFSMRASNSGGVFWTSGTKSLNRATIGSPQKPRDAGDVSN